MLGVRTSGYQTELWRCDGTVAGSYPIPPPPSPPPDEILLSWGMANDDRALWVKTVTHGRERLERLRFGDPSWTVVYDQRRPDADAGDGGLAFTVAIGTLWTTFADQRHGREPWVALGRDHALADKDSATAPSRHRRLRVPR